MNYSLIYIFLISCLINIIHTQADCGDGNLHDSITIQECNSRTTPIKTKCCLLSFTSDSKNVKLCYPIKDNANLKNVTQIIPDVSVQNVHIVCSSSYLKVGNIILLSLLLLLNIFY
jgi:hypothetical protein